MDISQFIPVWDKLDKTHQNTLEQSAVVRTFSKGEVLHNGSFECTGLIMVKSGQLRAYIVSEDGREITLYRLFDRDICLFSASCILRSIQFDIVIDAQKDTEIVLVASETYKRIMDESAVLANFTNEIMSDRFSEVMWLLEQVMWKNFDKRLAEFLVEESYLEGTDTLCVTHEKIGNHLGNPREVVTRMLKIFEREGMVTLSRGKIHIRDKDKLSCVFRDSIL